MKMQELEPGLRQALSTVWDPPSRHGRRHPLPAILALARAVLPPGARSMSAMAQWSAEQPPEVLHALGFTRSLTPGVATWHRIFTALDTYAFEAALVSWAQGALGGRGAIARWQRAARHPRRGTARLPLGG